MCSEAEDLGGVHHSQSVFQHLLLVQSCLCPVFALHSSHDIQWIPAEGPEEGSADSVRPAGNQQQGEEDEQDHLHVDHSQHRLPHR